MRSLEACELFKGLDPSTMDALKGIVEERSVSSGTVIFEEGAPGDGMYVVEDGEVEISASLDGGPPRTVSRLRSGEPFGEMAIIENKPRSATARASQPTRLSFLPSAGFSAILEQHPGLATAMLKQISHRLRDFTQHYVRETLQTERLALVGRFTGSIIHDLKNPLNVISISAELLGAEEADAELRRECSQRVRRQVERITDMVGEVLEFTRPDKQDFIPLRMRYSEFLQPVLEEERAMLAAHGTMIQVEGELPEDELLLNPKRLQRVFVNLMTNASEAMGKGGVIKFRFHSDSNGITAELEDSGPGITPEIAERLFEPFVTHGKPNGTGLGLAIARKIIDDHKGKISAGKGSGGGAMFRVWLPRPSDVHKDAVN